LVAAPEDEPDTDTKDALSGGTAEFAGDRQAARSTTLSGVSDLVADRPILGTSGRRSGSIEP
jgi:hypothetical protein